MVADALSRKSAGMFYNLISVYVPLLVELRSLDAQLSVIDQGVLLARFQVRPTLVAQIKET